MNKEPGSRKECFGWYGDGFRYTRPAFCFNDLVRELRMFYEYTVVMRAAWKARFVLLYSYLKMTAPSRSLYLIWMRITTGST